MIQRFIFCIFPRLFHTPVLAALVIGVSLTNEAVHVVVVERNAERYTLLAVDEWERQAGIGERLGIFAHAHTVGGNLAALALDSGHLFIATLPYDRGSSKSEIADRMAWELEQYFPDSSPGDFITDYHALAHDDSAVTHEILSVSVKRQEVRALNKELRDAGLELHLVDVDHFAADNVLHLNYPELASRHVAFVGVKAHRVDISLLRSGTLYRYSYLAPNSAQETVDGIAKLAREVVGLDTIMTYGYQLGTQMLADLRERVGERMQILDPFRHLGVADSLALRPQRSNLPHRFAPAIGVALRSAQP